MNDLLARFTSRKFLLALFGLVTILFGDKLHLTSEQIEGVIQVIIAFTAAEGLADAVTRYTNIPTVDDTGTVAQKSTGRSKT